MNAAHELQKNKGSLGTQIASALTGGARGDGARALDEDVKLVNDLHQRMLKKSGGQLTEKDAAFLKSAISDAVKGRQLQGELRPGKKLDELVTFLDKKGDAPVGAADVPRHLRSTWELFAAKHDLWVRAQVGYGSTSNADFVPTAQLPASRPALDAAPLRGAVATMLSALP